MSTHLAEETHAHTRRFFSGTLLSRLSGYGRDFAMAICFGDHPSIASFMIAFRIANLLRRLVAEGPFQSSFIPYFEGLRLQNPANAIASFRKLSAFFLSILLIVVIAAEISTQLLFLSDTISPEKREIVHLSRILFPSILFICLYGMNSSLLQCYGHFFLSGIAPAVLNVVWIVATFFLRNHHPSFAMEILAGCIVLGFATQWAFTLPTTLRYSSAPFKEWIPLRFPSELKHLLTSFSLIAIGIGAAQVNAFIDALFAKAAHPSGPVYLWYAFRMEQLALAIFGIACVTTIVPKLSHYIKGGDFANARFLFSFSFQRIISIMIPCTFAILMLGGSALNLSYGRGQFSQEALVRTTMCLWAYALGLLPSAMTILYSSLFYAQGHFRFPTRISLISIAVHISLNIFFILVLHLGATSIALSTSISAWLQYVALQKRAATMGWTSTMHFSRVLFIIAASLVASFSVLVVYAWLQNLSLIIELPTHFFARTFTRQAIEFLLPAFTFLLALFFFAISTRNKDLLEVFRFFFGRSLLRKINLQ